MTPSSPPTPPTPPMPQAHFVFGDCLTALKEIPDCSVDAIVTDPPAGIAFMGKQWDRDKGGRDNWIAWMQQIAAELLRVLKPGAHAAVWSLPRTSHWTATAFENAGFEVRDRIAHVFSSGFPKSLDVSKAIDRTLGVERQIVGTGPHCGLHHRGGADNFTDDNWNAANRDGDFSLITAPATPQSAQWSGYGTALKPAVEDWRLLRKPLDGTVAANVLKHGVGALNIDASRTAFASPDDAANAAAFAQMRASADQNANRNAYGAFNNGAATIAPYTHNIEQRGRYPTNLIHDGTDAVIRLFPTTTPSNRGASRSSNKPGNGWGMTKTGSEYNDTSSAARFFPTCAPDDDITTDPLFYCSKASRRDRDEGCEQLDDTREGMSVGAQLHGEGYDKGQDIGLNRIVTRKNNHPTVKSTTLMRFLCRLITPPNGTILDPFMGSGSTGKGAILEGFDFIGIEIDPDYLTIAQQRIAYAQTQYVQRPHRTQLPLF